MLITLKKNFLYLFANKIFNHYPIHSTIYVILSTLREIFNIFYRVTPFKIIIVIATGNTVFFDRAGFSNFYTSADDLIIKLLIFSIICVLLATVLTFFSFYMKKGIKFICKNKNLNLNKLFNDLDLLSYLFVYFLLVVMLFYINIFFTYLVIFLSFLTVFLVIFFHNITKISFKNIFLKKIINFLRNRKLFFSIFILESFRINLLISIIIGYFFFDLKNAFYLIIAITFSNQMHRYMSQYLNIYIK